MGAMTTRPMTRCRVFATPMSPKTESKGLSRRGFLAATPIALARPALAAGTTPAGEPSPPVAPPPSPALPDLGGARWLWYPSERTLPNTFVLFRKVIRLASAPRRAIAWVSADSRFLLTVNGTRAGWGPAPCDPRRLELDPIDITSLLVAGENVLGTTVLFFGHGDGTWAAGKPGFLARVEIETALGTTVVVSDESWACHLARAWRPGQYKRWYLRALQEEFDARLYPYGWDRPGYRTLNRWRKAALLDVPANKPPIVGPYADYLNDARGALAESSLRPRRIPPMAESVEAARLVEAHYISWNESPEDYFDFVVPNACKSDGALSPRLDAEGRATFALDGKRSVALTYELPEQMVGWPRFEIEAPAGTVVELMIQEAHAPGVPAIMNTHRHSWSRLFCRSGRTVFEPFDFECCRFIQVHVRGAAGKVAVGSVGLRRRQFPFANEPVLRIAEPGLQRLFDASFNTMRNSVQETLVDGMGRERQQYSGDIGHEVQAVHLAFGDGRLPARFLETWSLGQTEEGYFLDCWPGYDRLVRIGQRQTGQTAWGPIIDHGIGFGFDCWNHVLHGGALDDVREPYPRLLKLVDYLMTLRDRDGVLRVEDLGVPTVWMDHEAYEKQRHKQCAFNLYAAGMLDNALIPMARELGDKGSAIRLGKLARELLAATVRQFWDPVRGVFVVNRPWAAEERHVRLCDRSLSASVLFEQCPGGRTQAAIDALADAPRELGLSYPANAIWRLWGLGRGRRPDAIVRQLRQTWATLPSVRLNNTLAENWKHEPDTRAEWSHAPMGPLLSLFNELVGIRPLTPGFSRYELRPQLADLPALALKAHTPRGPIHFAAEGPLGKRRITLQLPPELHGELVVEASEKVSLPRLPSNRSDRGLRRYALPAGSTVELSLVRV